MTTTFALLSLALVASASTPAPPKAPVGHECCKDRTKDCCKQAKPCCEHEHGDEKPKKADPHAGHDMGKH